MSVDVRGLLLIIGQRVLSVVVDVCRRFDAQRGFDIAAALAFTTILALVPLLVVVFGAMSLFPAFHAWQGTIEHFIFHNFVPAMGEQVQAYLVEFTTKARELRAIGIAFLVVTVLSMLATIETTFNVIWGVRRHRPYAVRFLVYWAILTLGPLLIGIGIVATSALVSLPLLRATVDTELAASRFLTWLPLVATTTAFVLCYKLIPHCPVRLRHALIGGITAGLAFEAAKHLFAIYVTQFPTQQAVYGAFATLPIFLLWVYLSWVIVLVGAQLTHSLAVAPGPRRVPREDWRASDLYCAFRLLRQLHLAQHRGAAVGNDELRRLEPLLDHAQMDELLRRLEDARWIAQDNRFHWMLLRDLDDLTLGDLARITPPDDSVLSVPAPALTPEDQRLRTLLIEQAARSATVLGQRLSQLLADFATPAAEARPEPPLRRVQ
ncbi:MAG TPA: YihY family inner membrane protein [Gammaproteobacteria bacterium]|mgnify:CR=1 FL=1|nr:YihY family inner membrane protein [Gammaproteobacteria bacterium]